VPENRVQRRIFVLYLVEEGRPVPEDAQNEKLYKSHSSPNNFEDEVVGA
jgi:hypothetical protein